MAIISKKEIEELQLDELLLRAHVCNAPFVSLNFDQSGNINACCMSRKYSLGRYPETTILQAWTGPLLQEMRQAIDSFDFSKGCAMCYKQIIAGNYNNTLLKAFQTYDTEGSQPLFPTVMEFEISSICNYECIMCGGKWSSSIRKNREKLPPLKSPYDSNFVKQLEFFIPRLKHANFLGGEPFATPIYYDIWNKFIELKSNAIINLTTNGSVYNKHVHNILSRYEKMFICISLDSLNPDNYKFIRKNGNLHTVLENIEKIKREVSKKRIFSIAFCPMRQNWHEIPDLIQFCRQNNFSLCFNNVEGNLGGTINNIHEHAPQSNNRAYDEVENPVVTNILEQKLPEVCLYTLPNNEKQDIIKFLKNIKIPEKQFNDVVKGLIKRLQWSTIQ